MGIHPSLRELERGPQKGKDVTAPSAHGDLTISVGVFFVPPSISVLMPSAPTVFP